MGSVCKLVSNGDTHTPHKHTSIYVCVEGGGANEGRGMEGRTKFEEVGVDAEAGDEGCEASLYVGEGLAC